MNAPIIQISGLVKHFPIRHSKRVVQAVNDVSFEVHAGETFGLVGESGSGKTTVGRIILGLTQPTDGQVLFQGEEISRLSPKEYRKYRPRIQGVFQDPYDSLDARQQVGQVIVEPLVRMRLVKTPAERAARLEELLELTGIDRRLVDRYPHELSGGEQQKVGIARAIASRPDFIVLDEPTSALDVAARADVIELLRHLQRELNVTYLFITHDLKIVESIATRVAVMYLGKIVELGDAAEVFQDRVHPYTQALLGSVLYPDCAARGTVRVLKGEIPSPIDLPGGCYFHSRCPLGSEVCTLDSPPLDEFRERLWVACKKAKTSAELTMRSRMLGEREP